MRGNLGFIVFLVASFHLQVAAFSNNGGEHYENTKRVDIRVYARYGIETWDGYRIDLVIVHEESEVSVFLGKKILEMPIRFACARLHPSPKTCWSNVFSFHVCRNGSLCH